LSLGSGTVLSALDKRGAVLSTKTYPELPEGARRGQLLALADSVAVASAEPMNPNGSINRYEIRLRRFDRDANVVEPAAGLVLIGELTSDRTAATFDGQRIWIIWQTASSSDSTINTLMMAAFDPSGRQVVSPQVLDTARDFGVYGGNFEWLKIGAAAGRMLATWSTSTPAGYATIKYATIQATGSVQVRGLSLGPSTAYRSLAIEPIVSTSRQSLAWTGVLGLQANNDLLLRAVSLAGSGMLVPTLGETLDAQVLASVPGKVNSVGDSSDASTLYKGFAFADGDSFKASVVGVRRMIPAIDSFALPYLELYEWPTLTALADTKPTVQLRRLAPVGFSDSAWFGELRFVVPFEDHLIALGHASDSGATAAVVFRR
jgi:hypothetical protein